MSDLNNMSKVEELSTIEIILNFWKYKKSFFYILIPLFIISFFSTHLFPKKNIVQVRLVDPFLINLNVYPLETLYNIELDLASLHLEKIIAKTTREKFNYNLHFFRNNLMAHNNLIDFSKMNDEQYKLYDYVNKEKISVKIDIRDENIYSLTLPASKNNETFFKEYLIYVHNLSLEKLQTSLIDFENKNLLFLETEQKYIQFLYSSLYENYINSEMTTVDENNIIKKNLILIQNFQKEKKKQINENISLIKNIKKNYIKELIADGPVVRTEGSKIHNFTKFILPIILSLIIYFFYVLIKLTRNDTKS